jgi:hypothetical protein
MPDHTPIPNPLEARLDAWGESEHARISEPAPRFLAAVRAAQPPRHVPIARRITVFLAAAAAVALAAIVALRPPTDSTKTGDLIPPTQLTASSSGAPERIFTAGRGRDLSIDDILNTVDSKPAPLGPAAAPVRASDAYCAGCIEELTRI